MPVLAAESGLFFAGMSFLPYALAICEALGGTTALRGNFAGGSFFTLSHFRPKMGVAQCRVWFLV